MQFSEGRPFRGGPWKGEMEALWEGIEAQSFIHFSWCPCQMSGVHLKLWGNQKKLTEDSCAKALPLTCLYCESSVIFFLSSCTESRCFFNSFPSLEMGLSPSKPQPQEGQFSIVVTAVEPRSEDLGVNPGHTESCLCVASSRSHAKKDTCLYIFYNILCYWL